MLDVFFYETFLEEKKLLTRHLPPEICAAYTPKTIQEHGRARPPAKFISIRTQSLIPDAWANKLNGILSRTTGYEHLVDYLQKNKGNTPCGYLPNYCSRAVAEQAILMMLALMRKLRRQMNNFERFNRDGLTGVECAGKHLLVVGVGRIGSQVVAIGKALGMVVKGVDLAPKTSNIEYVSLAAGLSCSDVIICAAPLTTMTRKMFCYDTMKSCRPGTLFINIARGEISPLRDLKRLLDKGTLGGVGMDVFEEEGRMAALLRKGKTKNVSMLKHIQNLKQQDNVIFTPHNAFNTSEAVQRKAEQSIQAVVSFLGGRGFPEGVPVGEQG
jgi:D-lactate dehydrogenase